MFWAFRSLLDVRRASQIPNSNSDESEQTYAIFEIQGQLCNIHFE